MRSTALNEQTNIRCPSCGSDTFYRYGRAWTGKRRYLCLICNRQFTIGTSWSRLKDRPSCPACGRGMHIYKREGGSIRYRCSGYPKCRTFLKITSEVAEKK
jgi:ssDNA-binding Zn-finger/Zn-ribbon topoisomerase 1